MTTRISAIILAAGESRRFGKPKQLGWFRKENLVQRATGTALCRGLRPVVVLGANAGLIEPYIHPWVRIVHNLEWETGIASSIRVGVSAMEPDVDAVILMLCDQPLVSGKILSQFEARATAGLVAAEYNGTIGVPALFGREFFEELKSLEGAEGAKKILLKHADRVVRIPCPEAALDVDTPEDLERVRTLD
ncbi:MAG TPA: nucleotidyltransferase family protein [Verrucomicrobiae bacterium]|nr:nucleotidyltransferase family protein [Verrucomicrobiae bacterium]